ncbi:MAG: DUF6498-containing protein [Spirochaetia bacterium]
MRGALSIIEMYKHVLFSVLAANIYPVIGIFFLGWDPWFVLFLYWAETIIIGIMSILKISAVSLWNRRVLRAVITAFAFCVHYGLFIFVQGIILAGFFNLTRDIDNVFLYLLREIFDFSSVQGFFQSTFSGFVLLFLSYIYQFFTEFIAKREYQTTDTKKLIFAPYKRVFILDFTLLIGGGIIAFLSNITPGSLKIMFLVFIIIKIASDLLAFAGEKPKALHSAPAALKAEGPYV